MANAGVLLIASTLESLEQLNIKVDTLQVSKIAIPVAIIALVLWIGQNIILDKKLKKKYGSRKNNVGGNK